MLRSIEKYAAAFESIASGRDDLFVILLNSGGFLKTISRDNKSKPTYSLDEAHTFDDKEHALRIASKLAIPCHILTLDEAASFDPSHLDLLQKIRDKKFALHQKLLSGKIDRGIFLSEMARLQDEVQRMRNG